MNIGIRGALIKMAFKYLNATFIFRTLQNFPFSGVVVISIKRSLLI